MQLATLKGVTPPNIDEGAVESEGQEDPALGPAKLEVAAETAADKVGGNNCVCSSLRWARLARGCCNAYYRRAQLPCCWFGYVVPATGRLQQSAPGPARSSLPQCACHHLQGMSKPAAEQEATSCVMPDLLLPSMLA